MLQLIFHRCILIIGSIITVSLNLDIPPSIDYKSNTYNVIMLLYLLYSRYTDYILYLLNSPVWLISVCLVDSYFFSPINLFNLHLHYIDIMTNKIITRSSRVKKNVKLFFITTCTNNVILNCRSSIAEYFHIGRYNNFFIRF